MIGKATERLPHPLISIIVATCAMLIVAVAYLAANEWFGASDILTFAFWSLPLLVLLFVTSHLFRQSTASLRIPVRYVAGMVLALVLGIGYTLLPSFFLGPWIYAFSLPVGALWLIGSIVAFVAVVALGAPRTWRAALGLALAVPVLVLFGPYRDLVTPPDLVVVMTENATQAQTDELMNHAVGSTSETGIAYAELVTSATPSLYEGKLAIRLQLRLRTTNEQIDEMSSALLHMPGVLFVTLEG